MTLPPAHLSHTPHQAKARETDEFAPLEMLKTMLFVMAIILLVGGVGMMILGIVMPTGGISAVQILLNAIMVLLGTACVAGLMLGAAAALKLQIANAKMARESKKQMETLGETITALREAISTMPQQGYYASSPMVAPPPTAEEQRAHAAQVELARTMTEVRELMMMDEGQRLARGQKQRDERKLALQAVIERYVQAGNFTDAEREMRELRQMAPGDAAVEALAHRIETEQTRRLEMALSTAQDRVRHFIGMSAWQQAEDIVAGLRLQFPHHARVDQLAEEVANGRDAVDREMIARLYADIKDATEHRQWRRALNSAEELIRRYPNDRKTDKIKAEIATIRENAESQERREQEDNFKDLLKRQRYEEAHAVAMSVINKYPASPSAAELNKLLPKVEELIRQSQMARG